MSIVDEKYERLGRLGVGGMGEVIKARHRLLNRIDAIKFILREHAQSDEAWRRFNHEAMQQCKIVHENVVKVHDHFIDDGQAVIALEFSNAGSLHEHLQRRKPLPVAEALSFIRGALAGIGAAHRAGVIHRDIKPRNLMLHKPEDAPKDALPIVKVVDFGLAKSRDMSLSATNTVLGTVYYMSPEQGRGKVADKRSDIYSLGITLFELLTGDVPFTGPTTDAVINLHCNQKPASPRRINPKIPEHVERAILRALEKQPSDRFQSAEEFAKALEEPHEATISIPGGGHVQGPSIWPVLLALAVVLVVIVGIFLFVYSHKPKHEPPVPVHDPVPQGPAIPQPKPPQQVPQNTHEVQRSPDPVTLQADPPSPVSSHLDKTVIPATDFSGNWKGHYVDQTDKVTTITRLHLAEDDQGILKGTLEYTDPNGVQGTCQIRGRGSYFDASSDRLFLAPNGCVSEATIPAVLNGTVEFDTASPTTLRLSGGTAPNIKIAQFDRQ